ncbi:MAG: YaaL family protein [Clostridia bacterium]|nr:YaaL family protein [Clostridia bacterium]
MSVDLPKSNFAEFEKSGFLQKFFGLFSPKRNTGIKNSGYPKDTLELIETIKVARKEWMNAYTNFDYADDEMIVDYYTYKIKACQVRYEYLIKKAKEKGLKVDMLETYKTENYV